MYLDHAVQLKLLLLILLRLLTAVTAAAVVVPRNRHTCARECLMSVFVIELF